MVRWQTALKSVGTIKKVALTAIFPVAINGTSTFQRSKPLALHTIFRKINGYDTSSFERELIKLHVK